jgi:RHS repeat-associated protein
MSNGDGRDSTLYLHDHLGSPVRMIEDGFGEALAYDEFGVPLVGTQNIHQPFGFTGYQTEDVTGMWYAKVRYYDSVGARFTSEDIVIGEIDYPCTLNRYTYCINNPIMYVDSNGMSPALASIWNQRAQAFDVLANDIKKVPTVDNYVVTSNAVYKGDSKYLIETIINTPLQESISLSWEIKEGYVFIEFDKNDYHDFIMHGAENILAKEIMDVAKGIDENALSGRTVEGMEVDIQLHYAAYIFDRAVSNLFESFLGYPFSILGRFNPDNARIGGVNRSVGYHDSNAWVFESVSLMLLQTGQFTDPLLPRIRSFEDNMECPE